ncbi:Ig-like domain-containing protein [Rudanella paleaurantiibacter]|nr:PKD domain-containing protein [Rudanella paleaurantiibacter]
MVVNYTVYNYPASQTSFTLTRGQNYVLQDLTRNLCVSYKFTWTVTPNAGFTISSPNDYNPTINFNQPGSYYVTLAVSTSSPAGSLCPKTYDAMSKWIHIPYTTPSAQFRTNGTIVANASVISGNTVSFADASTNTPTAWSWAITPNTGWNFTSGSSTSQNPTVRFTTPGLYTVALTASNPAGSNTITKTNHINVTGVAPVASFLANSSSASQIAINQNSTVSFTDASTNTPTTWLWAITPGTGWNFTSGSSTSQNPTVQFTTPGLYNVALTASNSWGNNTLTKTNLVAVYPPPPTVTGTVYYCQGAQASPLTATGSNLRWYTVPSGGTASTTAPTPSAANTGTTSYYVSQIVNNLESSRARIDVVVTAVPAAPTVVSSRTYCTGATASPLSATGVSGSSLRWYTTATGGTGSGIAPTPSTAVPGTVTYYVSQAINSCESPRVAITIITSDQLPQPNLTVSGNLTFCTGSSTSLTANSGTPGVMYRWNTGNTTAAISISAAGVYSVTATATTGCWTTQSATVSSLATPSVSITTSTIIGSSTLTASSPTTGITYRWNTGAATGSVVVTTSGTYSVTATTPNSCSASSSTNVIISSLMVGIGGSTTLCSGSSTNLTATSNAANGTYRWNTGAIIPSISVNSSGTYSVTVTEGQTTAMASVVVTVKPVPVVSLSNVSASQLPGSATLVVNSSLPLSNLDWLQNGSRLFSAYSIVNTSYTTVAGTSIPGSTASDLRNPNGIFLDAAGNLYVADGGNHRVQRWAPGASEGITVAGGNGQGSAANQLDTPVDVWVDGQGNVYVADHWNHRVQRWPPGASAGVTVAGGNGQGSAANQLSNPRGITVDGQGNVYVADHRNHRVQRWAPGASAGVTVAGGNEYGSAANQLNYPNDVWVDNQGNLFVSDERNHRIQQWLPGASEGLTVAGGNGQGSAANQLSYPSDVWLDSQGNMYVVDENNRRIIRWAHGSNQGETLREYPRTFGSTNPQLRGIFVDSEGGFYVSSSYYANVIRYLITNLVTSTRFIPTQDGLYQANVRATNGCPATTNSIAIGSVSISGNLTLCTGGSTTLTAASQTPGSTFRWSTGATTATIVVVTTGTYTVTATAPNGTQSITQATVLSVPRTQLTTQPPSSLTLCEGSPLSVSVGGSGTSLTYQWYKGSLNTPLAGQTSSVLSLSALTAADAGTYFCELNSFCGLLRSQNMTLTVGQGPMTTVKAGAWNDPSVWSCGRVPVGTDALLIRHAISLPAGLNAVAKSITLVSDGNISYGLGSRLMFN